MYLKTTLEDKFNQHWDGSYDSSVGRFLEEDPSSGFKKDPFTFNSRYTYTISNPVNFVDPTGFISDFVRFAGGAALGATAAFALGAAAPVIIAGAIGVGVINTFLDPRTADFIAAAGIVSLGFLAGGAIGLATATGGLSGVLLKDNNETTSEALLKGTLVGLATGVGFSLGGLAVGKLAITGPLSTGVKLGIGAGFGAGVGESLNNGSSEYVKKAALKGTLKGAAGGILTGALVPDSGKGSNVCTVRIRDEFGCD